MNDRDRIDELEEEVLQLRSLLALEVHEDRLIALRETFGIKPGPAKLLHILLTRAVMSRRLAEMTLEIDVEAEHYTRRKTIDVQLSAVRASLKTRGIELRTVYGVGWSLVAPDKAKIEAMLA